MIPQVCLFFYVKGKFLIHGCSLDVAEDYGKFLIYPDSHFEIWNKNYYKLYHVDFDYFPRGRVAYHKETETFQILYDHCLDIVIKELAKSHEGTNYTLGYDEHYQCRMCNPFYIV